LGAEEFDTTGARGSAARADTAILPEGRRQEVVMIKTTNRTKGQGARRMLRSPILRPFGLHRTIAAAATVGVVCVFSLQMREYAWRRALGERSNADLSNASACGFGTSDLREESP
jgi:hypothetical protein